MEDQSVSDFVALNENVIEPKEFTARFTPASKEHIIVLIPGAITLGSWTKDYLEEVGLTSSLKFVHCGHFRPPVYSDLASDELPEFAKHIAAQIQYLARKHPSAKISIVAHSLGSHIAAQVVSELKEIEFYAIILLGSIVARRKVIDLASRCTHLINDCGTKDYVVILAEAAYRDLYSATGNLGFQSSACTDRFFHVGHSATTSKSHFNKTLRSLFLRNPEIEIPAGISPFLPALTPEILSRIAGKLIRIALRKL